MDEYEIRSEFMYLLNRIDVLELDCRYFADPVRGEAGAICTSDVVGGDITLIAKGLWVEAYDDAGEHIIRFEDSVLYELALEEQEEEVMAMADAMNPYPNWDFP